MRRRLPPDKERKFKYMVKTLSRTSRFDESSQFVQHGDTSVREHCIRVAQTAYYISYRLKLSVHEEELIRGALLHDYFIYDWHETSWKNSIHGFTHPTTALKEASRDFRLSRIEKDMIKHHMFPLTVRPPRSREGKILCVADKLCALQETIGGRI